MVKQGKQGKRGKQVKRGKSSKKPIGKAKRNSKKNTPMAHGRSDIQKLVNDHFPEPVTNEIVWNNLIKIDSVETKMKRLLDAELKKAISDYTPASEREALERVSKEKIVGDIISKHLRPLRNMKTLSELTTDALRATEFYVDNE